MANVIEQIHQDHVNMSKVLDMIESELSTLQKGDLPNLEMLEDAMRYIINYADLIHHPKEDAMFEQLRNRAPELREAVDEIAKQHRTLSDSSKQFFEIVKEAGVGEALRDEFHQKGSTYTGMLRRHMDLEEGHLLKEARSKLNQEDLEEIDDRYAQFRDPLLGESLEEEYRNLYHYLAG